MLYALPGFIVMFVAGLAEGWTRAGPAWRSAGIAAGTILLVLPLEFTAVVRTFALEPSGYFGTLVKDLQAHRTSREPVYVFARSLPAWIYYSTNWVDPDTLRLRYLTKMATSGGGGFENAPSRGRVREEESAGLTYRTGESVELLGLPSGMEWKAVVEHVRPHPDSGWAQIEAERIQRSASPGVWIIASSFYAPETELFTLLEARASRRTFARLRNGSALVRYEFGTSVVATPK
jgi:hypothetical protein